MRKGRRRSSFSVAGGSSKKISTLRDLGKKVAAGYKSQISQLTPQHLNLLATPPHFRTRTDLIQLAEALQWIPAFSGLDPSLVRSLCNCVTLVQLPAETCWYFGEEGEFEDDEDDDGEARVQVSCNKGSKQRPLACFLAVVSGKGQFRRRQVFKALSERELVVTARNLFNTIDVDNSGDIDTQELLDMLDQMGARRQSTGAGDAAPRPNARDIPDNARADDARGGAERVTPQEDPPSVDFAQFLAALRKSNGQCLWLDQLMVQKELKEVFSDIDEDGSGEIDQAELDKALKELGMSVPQESLQEFFVDEEGKPQAAIGCEQFVTICQTISDSQKSEFVEFSSGDSLGPTVCVRESERMEGGSLRAHENMKLLIMERSEFLRVEAQGQDGMLEAKMETLKQCPYFLDVDDDDILMIANCMTTIHKQRSVKVITEGSSSNGEMYFIHTGECIATKTVECDIGERQSAPQLSTFKPHQKLVRGQNVLKQPVTVSRMGKGDLFGEVLAFSKGENEYSVITSAPTTLFALHHEDVDMYLTEEHLDRLKGQSGMKETFRQSNVAKVKMKVLGKLALGMSGLKLDQAMSQQEERLVPRERQQHRHDPSQEGVQSAPASPREPFSPTGSHASAPANVPTLPSPSSRSSIMEHPIIKGPKTLSRNASNYLPASKAFKDTLMDVLIQQRAKSGYSSKGQLQQQAMQYMPGETSFLRFPGRRVSRASTSISDKSRRRLTPLQHRLQQGALPPSANHNSYLSLGSYEPPEVFRTVSILRHLQDGDLRCGSAKYSRRFAVPETGRVYPHDNLKRSLLTDPTWQPGASPRWKLKAARRVEVEVDAMHKRLRNQGLHTQHDGLSVNKPTTTMPIVDYGARFDVDPQPTWSLTGQSSLGEKPGIA
eukprot:CAMPEP_0114241856 /NCGR_PEP_ID=MMETSP0058-20121206/9854_1 /TAXON_ID=36894 /ORGANISM="Pyramimonas parkeae, CCMP726" /LENGTH=888 /DNA_ID=CAMNT_0001354407 /DNA_START=268 /DNA_END=2934 /DNA_ORIENTATION=-